MFRGALQGLLDYRTRVFFLPCSTELLLSSCVSGLGYVSGGADALADLISEFPGMVDQYCSLPEDGVETFLSPNHATGNVHAAGCPLWRIVNINCYRHVPPLAPPPT